MRIHYTARVRYVAELTFDVPAAELDEIEEDGLSLDEWVLGQIEDGTIMLPDPDNAVWELDDIDVDSDAEVRS